MPVTVKFRLDFLVCGLQGEVLWHFAMLAPCFPSHEALKNCRDWVFSNSGFELGLPAFQLPMFSKCDSLPKGYLWDMFVFRNPFPPFLLGIPSIQSLREAWVPESGSTFRHLCIALWLHHAHRFVAAAENGRKVLSYAEKQRVWSRSYGLQDLLQCSDCALCCAVWLLQTNEQLSRLSF